MARLSFLLLALWAIHPAVTQDVLKEGQAEAFQLKSVEKGSVSENPAHGVRLRLRQSRQCVDPGYLMCPRTRNILPISILPRFSNRFFLKN